MTSVTPQIIAGRRLSQYLILLIFSVLLPAVLLTGALVARSTQLDRSRADHEALQLARSAAAALDREIDGSIESLMALSLSPAIADGDLGSFYVQARDSLKLRHRNALLTRIDGQQVVNTRVAWGDALPLDPLTGYMAPVLKNHKVSVTDLVIGSVAKKWVVAFSVPVFTDQKLAYVLSMSIDPDHIQKIVSDEKLDRGWIIEVTDSQNRIIARTQDHAASVGKIRQEGQNCTEPEGVTRQSDSERRSVVSAHSCLSKADWQVTAFIPAEIIDAPLRRLWWIFTASSAVFLFGALPLAFLVAQKIADPIRATAVAAERLGRGETIQALESPLVEANSVSLALSRASIELSSRTKSLAESEAQFRSVFEQAAVGFKQLGIDGRVLGVNLRLCKLLGYSREECLEKSFRVLTHPQDIAIEEAEIERLMKGEIDTYSVEKRLIGKSGDAVWVRVTSSLVRNADGTPMYRSSVVEDVTESRRARLQAAQLAAIVQASADALISTHLDGEIRTWNPGAEALLGYTAKEIVGGSLTMLVPPEHHNELKGDLDAVSKGDTVRREAVWLGKDGTLVDVAISATPILSNDAITAISLTMEDIRDRKRREAQIILLNRELAHRVKNTLAVVQSLANQTLRTSSNSDEFRFSFQGRLQALAAATDMLTQTNWGAVDFSEFIDRQLAPIFANAPRQLRKSGQNIILPSDYSIPIGLALHELGTNATKYGAWSVDSGYVEISWETRTANDDRRLFIRWSEHRGPNVEPPKRVGFGTALIERGIPGAIVDRNFNKSGLVCTIDIAF